MQLNCNYCNQSFGLYQPVLQCNLCAKSFCYDCCEAAGNGEVIKAGSAGMTHRVLRCPRCKQTTYTGTVHDDGRLDKISRGVGYDPNGTHFEEKKENHELAQHLRQRQST